MSGVNATLNSILSRLDKLETSVDDLASTSDEVWHITCAIFMILMQIGFAMLEAGSVRSKSSTNVLTKNVLNMAISILVFWLFGYAFAFGRDKYGLIGTNLFALQDKDYTAINDDDNITDLNFHTFFLQWSYASVAIAIPSGCLAERCKLHSYLFITTIIISVIYPIATHWIWGGGWLSAFSDDRDDYLFNGEDSNNVIDFAGGSVVHMVGGFSGLVGSMLLGARKVLLFINNVLVLL